MSCPASPATADFVPNEAREEEEEATVYGSPDSLGDMLAATEEGMSNAFAPQCWLFNS